MIAHSQAKALGCETLRGRSYRQAWLGVFASWLLLGFVRTANAEEYRRPGLEGKWSRRHLTSPMNSLNILVGPGQPMLLGGRCTIQKKTAHPSPRRT